jgi:hypothetical protein
MKCELCGKETEFGNPYYCYYGTLISSSVYISPPGYGGTQTRSTISKYRIAGEKRAWFCDACVATRYGTEQRNPSIYGCLITGFLMACCPSLLLFQPSENLGALFKIVALFALLLGFAALFPLVRGIRALRAVHGDPNALHALLAEDLAKNGFITACGDALVIQREKAGLKEKGFDSFLTRKDNPTPIQPPPA